MSPAADWNIDWFRHCRELIEPVDYLTRPYYDQWLQTYAAMLVNSDIATVQELASGQATSRPSGLGPTMSPVDVATAKRSERNFAQNIKERPALDGSGNAWRAKSHGVSGHTRLPGYVRGLGRTDRGVPWCARFPGCERAWRETG